MPDEGTRSMLTIIEERIRSSGIRVEHRDMLIRLRTMIEDDLTAVTQAGARSAQHRRMPRFGSAANSETLRPSFHKRPPAGRLHPFTSRPGPLPLILILIIAPV